MIQSQSSQQSDSPGQQQQTAALLHHHPDCAAVIRPLANNTHQFFSTHGSPVRHKQPQNLNNQLLDNDSVDEIGIQQFNTGSSGTRQPLQPTTMHNQPSLFGMRPSNLINSSQDEECESDLASISNQQQQINGQLNRDHLDYNEENEIDDEDELIDDDQQPTVLQQQQSIQQVNQMIRNRPQFRQLSSNSNNDSNDSDPTALNNNLTGLNDEKHQLVPLQNRFQQQQQQNLNNKTYGSKMTETNLGGQQASSQQMINNNSTPSQQQRNFAENRQNCAPDVVTVMR